MVRKIIDFLAVMLFTFALLTITVKLFSNNTVLDDYLTVKGKIISLIFLRTDECITCNKSIKNCMALLNSDINSDVYAIINVKREIELKKVSQLYSWRKPTIQFKEEMLKKFDIKKDCLVVVFDPGGKKLGEVSRHDKNAYSKLIKIYKGGNS
jgi:hypothetical protein